MVAENIILLNLPDLSKTPITRSAGTGSLLSKGTFLFNKKLKDWANLFSEAGKVNIEVFDVHSIFNDLLKNLDKYNKKYDLKKLYACDLSDPVNPAYKIIRVPVDKNSTIDYYSKTAFKYYTGSKHTKLKRFICKQPNSHVFWDFTHLSAPVHYIIGMLLYEFIKSNFIIANESTENINSAAKMNKSDSIRNHFDTLLQEANEKGEVQFEEL
jgi:phospholipase/lecithinase/hemolysin